MAKRSTQVKLRTWGIYTAWDSEARQLPKLLEIATDIPAEVDIEFGFVANIRGARNRQLHYCIDHPGIIGTDGRRRDPFTGTVYVRTNDWDFFLGDTIWEPVEDKIGTWNLSIALEGVQVAAQSFQIFRPE